MTDSTDDLAARLRSAAEAATPGPWEADTMHNIFKESQPWRSEIATVQGDAYEGVWRDKEDAAYIALANPENVLALLDERTRLRTALLSVRETDGYGAWLQEHNAGDFEPECPECQVVRGAEAAALGTTEGADNE